MYCRTYLKKYKIQQAKYLKYEYKIHTKYLKYVFEILVFEIRTSTDFCIYSGHADVVRECCQE